MPIQQSGPAGPPVVPVPRKQMRGGNTNNNSAVLAGLDTGNDLMKSIMSMILGQQQMASNEKVAGINADASNYSADRQFDASANRDKALVEKERVAGEEERKTQRLLHKLKEIASDQDLLRQNAQMSAMAAMYRAEVLTNDPKTAATLAGYLPQAVANLPAMDLKDLPEGLGQNPDTYRQELDSTGKARTVPSAMDYVPADIRQALDNAEARINSNVELIDHITALADHNMSNDELARMVLDHKQNLDRIANASTTAVQEWTASGEAAAKLLTTNKNIQSIFGGYGSTKDAKGKRETTVDEKWQVVSQAFTEAGITGGRLNGMEQVFKSAMQGNEEFVGTDPEELEQLFGGDTGYAEMYHFTTSFNKALGKMEGFEGMDKVRDTMRSVTQRMAGQMRSHPAFNKFMNDIHNAESYNMFARTGPNGEPVNWGASMQIIYGMTADNPQFSSKVKAALADEYGLLPQEIDQVWSQLDDDFAKLPKNEKAQLIRTHYMELNEEIDTSTGAFKDSLDNTKLQLSRHYGRQYQLRQLNGDKLDLDRLGESLAQLAPDDPRRAQMESAYKAAVDKHNEKRAGFETKWGHVAPGIKPEALLYETLTLGEETLESIKPNTHMNSMSESLGGDIESRARKLITAGGYGGQGSPSQSPVTSGSEPERIGHKYRMNQGARERQGPDGSWVADPIEKALPAGISNDGTDNLFGSMNPGTGVRSLKIDFDRPSSGTT